MMLIKITGESLKFIGSKYIQESLINMSLELNISYLNKHYSHTSYIKHFTSIITISQHREFKVKIRNNPNKQIITTTESSRSIP